MGSIFLYVQVSINKMKALLSILFVASVFNWIEGAPLSSHNAMGAIHSGDICKKLELQESEHHLLADPDDCKKFFSCQYSRTGWLAYSMSCADGTHFDGVYCVSEDCPFGTHLVSKEDQKLSTPKYYTTTTKSTSTLTATEEQTTTQIPSTNIPTEIPTTITTTEIPTTTITTEIPTTTITTEIPTSITTEIPTTITTETPTTIITTEIPTTTVTTEIPSLVTTPEIPTARTSTTTAPSTARPTRTVSSSPTKSSKAVVTPRKFLPDETQGEFLPVESSTEEFSTETEEGSGEFLIEDTTEYEIGSGEMW